MVRLSRSTLSLGLGVAFLALGVFLVRRSSQKARMTAATLGLVALWWGLR
jgi:hypothetical protein